MAKAFKRSKSRINMIHIFFICFFLYFAYTILQQQFQISKYNSQISMYESEIESKNSLVKYYSEQKSSITSDEYIEQIARETLGYVKPYEKVFIDANK